MSIHGKVALVTGAGQGIGRAIALRLASHGADIAIVDRNAEPMERVANEVRAAGRKATTFKADISAREQVFAAAERELGEFDIMINNAGIASIQPILDVTPEELDKILRVNVAGVLWAFRRRPRSSSSASTRARSSAPRRSRGTRAFRCWVCMYSATKFAVRALTQAAAKKLAVHGITVNAYCPGVVGTDMWVEIDRRMAEITGAPIGESYEKFVGGIALGRAETPEDVAAFVSYLAGPDSDYMTGQAPMIDGGLVYR